MNTDIDSLIHTAVFSENDISKHNARKQIRQLAQNNGVIPSSIHNLYMAIGNGKVAPTFTIPAINIRTLTYDTARILFRLAQKYKASAFICEIARSEIEYTDQRPDEYAVCILAAAIKEEYKGPVFIQADHVQFSKTKFGKNPEEETEKIKALVKEAIEAGFLNVDIDASTLVDLSKENLDEQQKTNSEITAELTRFIRELEPQGIVISIGGEIGHIGGNNSTVLDFDAFMKGYQSIIKEQGISKVSVQTGTSHGGIPLPDGTIADIKLDFNVLKEIGRRAREEYHIGGAVQHGASTLPNDLFNKFVEAQTLEIHLATGFQNIVYGTIPKALKEKMFIWIDQNLQKENEEGWTHDQFLYKTRKKALGPFKKRLWELSDTEKQPIIDELTSQFEFLFNKLNISDTENIVNRYISNH